MPRSFLYGVMTLAFVAAAASGCDKSTPATPPSTTPVEITEPDFTGTLQLNGGVTLPFNAITPGQVSATVKSLDPNTEALTKSVGVALGIWNGTSCQLAAGLFNDNAGVNSGVAGTANAAGTLCVRVYDPGILTEPLAFVVIIKHF